MAGSSSKQVEGKKKARIEIIPLIDVIFFLLATFVLFILSLEKIQSLPVDLPVAHGPVASARGRRHFAAALRGGRAYASERRTNAVHEALVRREESTRGAGEDAE